MSSTQIEHMRPAEAARYLGVSVSTLAKLRMVDRKAEGPGYSKINGCVIYRREDLDAWVHRHMVSASPS